MGAPEMFTRFPTLETPRLLLRLIAPRDAESLFTAFSGSRRHGVLRRSTTTLNRRLTRPDSAPAALVSAA
jgi:hypothetical protein